MSRKLVLVIAAIALIASTGLAFAAGTPTWWDNPNNYSSWRTFTTSGKASNSGGQTQLISVIWDIDNLCPPAARIKEVWEQISWNAPDGGVILAQNNGILQWTKAACPASTETDLTSPVNPVFMLEQDTFTPDSPYTSGWERSARLNFTSGNGPTCERILTGWQVNQGKSVDYQLEVQTLCTGPNAVSLRDLSAKSSAALPALPAVGALSVLALAPVMVLARRRRSSR